MMRIITILMGAVIFAAVFAQLVGYGVLYTVAVSYTHLTLPTILSV